MIFNDQKTAEEFRTIAKKQLISTVVDAIEKMAMRDGETWRSAPEHVKQSAVDHMIFNEPSLWRTLLFRSGIVFSSSYGDVHDAIFYYDDDERYDFKVSESIREHGMVGGIDKTDGSTHT